MDVVMKKTEEKKPFQERWNSLAPKAQDRFYRMKCRQTFLPDVFPGKPLDRGTMMHMRDNMKPLPNGKGHPKVEPIMSC